MPIDEKNGENGNGRVKIAVLETRLDNMLKDWDDFKTDIQRILAAQIRNEASLRAVNHQLWDKDNCARIDKALTASEDAKKIATSALDWVRRLWIPIGIAILIALITRINDSTKVGGEHAQTNSRREQTFQVVPNNNRPADGRILFITRR